MSEYILEMKGITKEFPGVKALDNVTFKVKRGEIHCLVGENGAGKSTLMKVLSGVYPHGTYTGDIVLNGEVQKFAKIKDSEDRGIGIIYQELSLFPELTVYENIFIGNEIKKGMTIDFNETIVRATELLNKVKVDLSPASRVKEHGVGKQQLVEIAKALSKDVKLLILDEPTAALNEDDSENLLVIMDELRKQGISCIMISHKLKEVTAIADTVTVIRDGQSICSLKKEEITEATIIKHMVGREITDIYPKREGIQFGEKSLEVKNWTAFDPKLNREVLKDIHFNVRKGEIIGLAGLMGSGRTELAKSIFGNTTNYKLQGEVRINEKPCKIKHPKDAIDLGLAYVSEDRKGDGLILSQTIRENISISNLEKLTNATVINESEEVVVANQYLKDLNVKAPSIASIVGKLSGGNQQKVSLGKWLFTAPNVLILDEPTRGIDVGAKFEIYSFMNKLVAEGMSIIMISSELPEVLGMSDRIYVMASGQITGELPIEEATQEKIMEMATV